jgi:hypothetical protein
MAFRERQGPKQEKFSTKEIGGQQKTGSKGEAFNGAVFNKLP